MINLKRFLSVSIISISFSLLFSTNYKITYESSNNNEKGEDRTYLFEDSVGGTELESKERTFIDYNLSKIVKVLKMDDDFYKRSSDFTSFGNPEYFEETEKILGYKCKKARYDLFSNKLDVWYTTKTKAKGSPIFTGFPENSLVLKLVYNGNFTLVAKDIEKYKDSELNYIGKDAEEVDEAKYQKILIESRYTTLPIFDKEQINFGDEISNPKEEILNHTYRFSKGTIVMKKIKLPEIHPNGNVFLKLTTWSNGDAYDRTGTIFTIAKSENKSILDALKNDVKELPVYKDINDNEYQGVAKTDDYLPPIELMRFFTTFGVGHFNYKVNIAGYTWSDSVIFKQEITELMEEQEEMWIGVFIGNYDNGGHKVSLEMNYYPAYSEEETAQKWIQPLFNTLNIMEMSGQNYGKMFRDDKLVLDFELEEGIDDLQLRFITTGHGGWGNGDEFVKRANRIYIDGKEVFRVIPWREDCGTYRLNNPASGNFGNGLSSSDLSRSNWCPGTITTPYYIPLDDLKPGKHTIEVDIDQGADEGRSFNSWNVSGVLMGQKN